jgi:hypothetical protein
MDAVEYRAEELPGDLYRMAVTAEQFAPGYGVKIVMSWADNFRAQPVYWPRLDKVSRKIREKEEVELKDIKSNIINMLADDATKVCPDHGLIATLMVGMSYRQQRIILHNLDDVKRPHRDKWILETYENGIAVAWEIGVAVGIGLRQVEKILATGGATVERVMKQRDIFEFV